ncbi:MAG: transglycosylase SLT domain-containing protein [Hormoscilla sp. GM102CHS1]|nr:transglycosylase SLT domain-containing protein [Hormoscilla sp. GM102CHS1]
MFKEKRQRNNKVSWAACAGIGVLLMGVTLHKTPVVDGLRQRLAQWSASAEQSRQLRLTPIGENSVIGLLVQLAPRDREQKLQALAQETGSIESNRARYLLASDLIEQQQGQQALALLEKLERDYPVLGSHIALKRAQAYEVMGDRLGAISAWKDLQRRYSQDPVAAEALLALGSTDPKYWEKAIAQFPAHPGTVEMAYRRLSQEDTDQLPLLLLLAKHAHYRQDYTALLNQLVSKYKEQLTAADWEAIAFGYWEKEAYGEAGVAYRKAPATPVNRYRAGRGLQLGGKKHSAIRAYKQLIEEFPDAKITARGMLHLSRLSEPKYALNYLEKVQTQFPDFAAEALLEKSKVLNSLGSAKAAFVARESLLTQYSNSDEAAQLRWRLAQKRAQGGELTEAWEWAQQLMTENPDSPLAPEAAFWVGKWASRLGRTDYAQQSFAYVIMRYPESYYAWRSAVLLGWDVGDFKTMRKLKPQLDRLPVRSVLLAGSDTLKELYHLGQDTDAWKLWQVEFTNRSSRTVAEQFTDGLIRLAIEEHLEGIFMINSLSWRDEPAEREQVKMLKQQLAYWQALYPFPYLELILSWSEKYHLNSLLVVGLIRQESRFMEKIESPVGATGLMQVMPETGAWIADQINLTDYKLNKANDNIQLGTWYLDFTHWQYQNNSMLAVASYNAGTTNVDRWVERFGLRDPDRFVEFIPFGETKGYVKSVFGNYWNYARLYDPMISQQLAQLQSAVAASTVPEKSDESGDYRREGEK